MPAITLSMIVKNEEKYLRECLDSVKDVVDEIVIVDTGSTDSTIEIAKSFGAKVYNFEWINDFSAARNFALHNSTGDYILYLDADERLDEHSIPEIKRLVASKQKAAYYCTVKSYDTEGGRDHSMRYTRIFANLQGLTFTGKVHEQITPSLLENGIKLIQTKVLIHHLGYDVSSNDKMAKAKRNLSLLLEEDRHNKSPYNAFQLGQTYNIIGDEENAVKYFKIASESGKLEKQHRALCFTSLALIFHKNHKVLDAEKYLHHSIKIDDKQPFAYLLASKIALRKSELIIAEERCKRAYILNKEFFVKGHDLPLVVILNPEEVIYYGLILALQNKSIENIQFYQKELFLYYQKQESQTEALKKSVIQKLFSNSSFNPEEIETLIKMCNPANVDFFVLTLENNPLKLQVIVIVERLLNKIPNSIELRKLNAKTLDELGKIEEAMIEMEKIMSENEKDPAVFFYLISYYIKLGLVDKIKPIVLKLEKNFSNIPDIMTRVTMLKRSLQMLATVPQ